MHRLLIRQLKRYAPGWNGEVPSEWQSFIDVVDSAYHQNDEDRSILERALELSSNELLEKNSELQTLWQALPDLCLVLDRDGTILERRGAHISDFVVDSTAVLNRRLHDVLSDAPGDQLDDAIDRVNERGEMITIEYSAEQSDHPRHFEARLLPLLTDQIMVIIRNVTEHKEAERQLVETALELESSNAELEQFAYVASHDLQEPLRTVQSYLQLLQRRYQNRLEADADEFIQFAVDGASRMRQLIQALLTYARVSSRAQPFETTDIGATVDDVIASLRVAITESGAVIERDELPTIPADERQITQLYLNLLSNAIKFRGDAIPRIRVGAERDNASWRFFVSDNGIGLDAKYRYKIFDIFKRLHRREEYSGTGIGLAVCKKIVERHGGRIWVESEPGGGSTFFFTLPNQQEEPQ